MNAEVTCVMERPNRLALRLKAKGLSYAIVCDGQTLWRYIERDKEYVRGAAPATFDNLLEGGPLQGTVWRLFGRNPYEALLQGVVRAQYIGQEQEDRRALHRVRLFQGPTTVDLWVDAKDLLIRRLRAVTRSAAGEETVFLEEKHKVTGTNRDLEPAKFQFEPPQGARQVAAFGTASLRGREAPDVELEMADGRKVKISDFRGKVVLLHFWATWSGPQRRQMSTLDELCAEYAGKDVVFLAVNVREDAETATVALRSHGYRLTLARDPQGQAAEKYGVVGFPTTYLLDASGIVRLVHHGLPVDTDLLKADLRRELDALLRAKTEVKPPKAGKMRSK